MRTGSLASPLFRPSPSPPRLSLLRFRAPALLDAAPQIAEDAVSSSSETCSSADSTPLHVPSSASMLQPVARHGKLRRAGRERGSPEGVFSGRESKEGRHGPTNSRGSGEHPNVDGDPEKTAKTRGSRKGLRGIQGRPSTVSHPCFTTAFQRRRALIQALSAHPKLADASLNTLVGA